MADSINIPSPESLVTQISPLENKSTESKPRHNSTNAASTSAASNPYNLCEYNMTPDMLSQSFNITLKFISPAASSGPFCRICHEGDTLEDLVSLCKCTGSMGLVHLTCMERWLSTRRNAAGRDQCEICNYSFDTIRSPKSLTEWYHSDQGPMTNRHSVLGDVACFSLITPLAAVSTFLCLEGAKRHVMWSNSLEAGCLMALATFLVTVYVIWNVLTIRYHFKNYYRWRSLNQNVRLVRFRRKSTREQVDHQTDGGSTEQLAQNGNSRPELVANNHPILLRSSSESDDINAQTSDLCLTAT